MFPPLKGLVEKTRSQENVRKAVIARNEAILNPAFDGRGDLIC
jgi:hypothetical protein